MKIAIYYLLAVNLLAFIAYGYDKWKSQHQRHARRRTPEATLLLLAALGGSIGSLLAMHLFRHKTLHRKFTLGVPTLLLLQAALAVAIFLYLHN